MPAIPELRGALFNINPSGKTGNCAQCAVEAAKVLTKGRAARPASDSRELDDEKYASKEVKSFDADEDRAANVRNWLLSSHTPSGVYAVSAGEDHAFNFIKTTQGKLYVVDSNLHIYLRVNPQHANDWCVPMDGEIYNYADADDGEGGDMTIFYWGAIEPRWNDKLNMDA